MNQNESISLSPSYLPLLCGRSLSAPFRPVRAAPKPARPEPLLGVKPFGSVAFGPSQLLLLVQSTARCEEFRDKRGHDATSKVKPNLKAEPNERSKSL